MKVTGELDGRVKKLNKSDLPFDLGFAAKKATTDAPG
jgi:hypothetical protein